jgi:putative PIN family toxin of toxin-antitoxin system
LKKQEPKVVLDTNVWISALLWGGKPAAIIKAAENRKITILITENITAEISQVLAYPKIEKIYRAELSREQLIEQVLKTAKFVEAKTKVTLIKEHPADDKFLECALAARADYLVSGDKHLLKVGSYKKTKILTVNDFLTLIE